MSPNPPTPILVSHDPGPRVRALVALVLRVGLGLTLLKRGVVDHLSLNGATSPGFLPTRAPISIDLELSFHYLAYAEMALGLALILGFFTTVAAVLAAFLQLGTPLLQTIITLSAHFVQARGMNVSVVLGLYEASATSNLLMVAAVLWFSPVTSNPWSLDQLIFVRREGPIRPGTGAPASTPAPDQNPTDSQAPAPAPGSRTRAFIANHEE
jgi:uncharacterized membrane protein YphA (DoxX/SURF4 family)